MKIEGLRSYHNMDSYKISNNKETYYALAYLQDPLKDGDFKREDLAKYSLRIFDNKKDFDDVFFSYRANMPLEDHGWEARSQMAEKQLENSLIREDAIRRKFEQSSANFNALAEERGLVTEDRGMSNDLEF